MEAFVFRDLLEDGPPLKVLARVSFFKSEQGGREQPCVGKYRPNHNFGGPENRNFYIGQLELLPGESIHPGENRDVRITFLNGAGLSELLQVGRNWRIQEGIKHVANAEVLAVHNEV